MLVEFRVKNFKPFRDEQVFSLVASTDKTLPENTVRPTGSKLRLLKSAVVYGPNAAGKTSLLDALHSFTGFIRRSATGEADKPIDAYHPFLFDEQSQEAPGSFEATFILDGVRYQYGFTVNREQVLEEWLLSYPKGRPRRLFRRFQEEGRSRFEFSVHLKGEKNRLKGMTRPNVLFLSVGAAFNNRQLSTIHTWLSKQIRGLQAPYASSRPFWLTIEEEERERFTPSILELLRMADVGITDFEFVEQELLGVPGGKLVSVNTFHRSGADKTPLRLDDESRGTQQLFSLGYFILPALAQGKVLFIDELDASLHPLLVRGLVKLFHNPEINTGNTQLIFNTHDTTLLSSSLLRRDQIWLVEKDADSAAHLYSLLEYSPRKGEALEKGYLQGRYGAIPFLSAPDERLILR